MDNVERKLVNSAPRRRKFGVCQTHFLFVKRWNSDAFDVEINENQSGDNNLSTGRDVEATVSVPNKEWALDFLKVFYWVNFRKKLVCYVNSDYYGYDTYFSFDRKRIRNTRIFGTTIAPPTSTIGLVLSNSRYIEKLIGTLVSRRLFWPSYGYLGRGVYFLTSDREAQSSFSSFAPYFHIVVSPFFPVFRYNRDLRRCSSNFFRPNQRPFSTWTWTWWPRRRRRAMSTKFSSLPSSCLWPRGWRRSMMCQRWLSWVLALP